MVCFSDVANIWPEQPSFIVECNLSCVLQMEKFQAANAEYAISQ